jgi:two-component sensor histidine kinase
MGGNVIRVVTEEVTGYERVFGGQADQVSLVRREIASYLAGGPAADDVLLIASELATNAVLHSRSRGRSFTIRVEQRADQVLIECEDLGGPWRRRQDDDRPHGLDIVATLVGPDCWGTRTTAEGTRITWARRPLES